MARTYTAVPTNTFKELVRNAGVLLKGSTAFDPTKKELSEDKIFGATSGGVSFSDAVSYVDYGDDIDNCPKNTKELKEIESREVSCSGTFVTLNAEIAKFLIGGAEVDENNSNHIIPVDVLDADADFDDIWFVTDYSEKDGGFVAIHLKNCLSTGGFQLQSTDKAKGQFSFTFTAHYSMADADTVPYDIYIVAGTTATTATTADDED